MKKARNPRWRGAMAAFVALVLLVLSAAAPVHSHSDASSGACVVCQFEHSPALATATLAHLPPVPDEGPAFSAVAHRSPHSPLLNSADGRAPPQTA